MRRCIYTGVSFLKVQIYFLTIPKLIVAQNTAKSNRMTVELPSRSSRMAVEFALFPRQLRTQAMTALTGSPSMARRE